MPTYRELNEEEKLKLRAIGKDPNDYDLVAEGYDAPTSSPSFAQDTIVPRPHLSRFDANIAVGKRAIAPGIGGLATGALAQAGLRALSIANPWIGIPLTIGSAVAGAYGANKVQEKVVPIGKEEALRLQQARKEYPYSTLATEQIPSLLAFRPSLSNLQQAGGAVKNLVTRTPLHPQQTSQLLNVGVGAGLGAGQEGVAQAREGELNVGRLLLSTLAGAAINEPHVVGRKVFRYPASNEGPVIDVNERPQQEFPGRPYQEEPRDLVHELEDLTEQAYETGYNPDLVGDKTKPLTPKLNKEAALPGFHPNDPVVEARQKQQAELKRALEIRKAQREQNRQFDITQKQLQAERDAQHEAELLRLKADKEEQQLRLATLRSTVEPQKDIDVGEGEYNQIKKIEERETLERIRERELREASFKQPIDSNLIPFPARHTPGERDPVALAPRPGYPQSIRQSGQAGGSIVDVPVESVTGLPIVTPKPDAPTQQQASELRSGGLIQRPTYGQRIQQHEQDKFSDLKFKPVVEEGVGSKNIPIVGEVNMPQSPPPKVIPVTSGIKRMEAQGGKFNPVAELPLEVQMSRGTKATRPVKGLLEDAPIKYAGEMEFPATGKDVSAKQAEITKLETEVTQWQDRVDRNPDKPIFATKLSEVKAELANKQNELSAIPGKTLKLFNTTRPYKGKVAGTTLTGETVKKDLGLNPEDYVPKPLKSSVELWADGVIKESRKMVSSGLQLPDPELLAAYATKGAILAYRGVKDVGAELTRIYGDKIKPILEDVVKYSKELMRDDKWLKDRPRFLQQHLQSGVFGNVAPTELVRDTPFGRTLQANNTLPKDQLLADLKKNVPEGEMNHYRKQGLDKYLSERGNKVNVVELNDWMLENGPQVSVTHLNVDDVPLGDPKDVKHLYNEDQTLKSQSTINPADSPTKDLTQENNPKTLLDKALDTLSSKASGPEAKLGIVPAGNNMLHLGPMSGQIDRFRRALGNAPLGKYVADKIEAFYIKLPRYEGKYTEGMKLSFSENFTNFKEFLLGNHKESVTIDKYFMDMKKKGSSNVKLSESATKLVTQVRELLREVRVEQNTKGIPVEDVEGFRQGEINDNYYPETVASPVVNELLTRPYSEKSRVLKEDFIKFHEAKLGSRVRAEKRLQELLDSVKSTDVSNKASQFGPIDKAEGWGVPDSWREHDPLVNLTRYFNRVSRRFAYWDTIQSDPRMLKALGYKSDVRGERVPLDVKLEDGTTVVDTIGNNPLLQPILKDIEGRHNIDDIKYDAYQGVVKSGIMGPLTGGVDFVGSNFLGWVHMVPKQNIPALLSGWSNIKNNVRKTLKQGVSRQNFGSFETLQGGASEMTAVLHNARDFLNKVQLRSWFEQLSRANNFGQGRWLAIDNIRAIHDGHKTTMRLKFFEDFAKGVEWKKHIKDGILPDNVLDEIASQFVETVQGTYTYRGLPRVAQEGGLAPFLALARWNVEKANNFMKHVVNPAQQGNFIPLFQATVGTFIGGAAIEALRELASGRKVKTATYGELGAAKEEGQKTSENLFYKLAGLASAASYAGMLGDIVKIGWDMKFGNKYMEPLNNPLISVFQDNVVRLGQAVNAALDGEEDVMVEYLAQFLENNIQGYRILASMIARGTSLTPEKSDQINRANKSRDYRVYRELHDLPTSDISGAQNMFRGRDTRDFKHSKDIDEIIDKGMDLKFKSIERYRNNPEQMLRSLEGLAVNPTTDMPSHESSPYEFMNYLEFIEKTQGKEVASQRLQEYIEKKQYDTMRKAVITGR